MTLRGTDLNKILIQTADHGKKGNNDINAVWRQLIQFWYILGNMSPKVVTNKICCAYIQNVHFFRFTRQLIVHALSVTVPPASSMIIFFILIQYRVYATLKSLKPSDLKISSHLQ